MSREEKVQAEVEGARSSQTVCGLTPPPVQIGERTNGAGALLFMALDPDAEFTHRDQEGDKYRFRFVGGVELQCLDVEVANSEWGEYDGGLSAPDYTAEDWERVS